MYKTMTRMTWYAEALGDTFKGVPTYSDESGLIAGFKYGNGGYMATDIIDTITQVNLETDEVTKIY